jgi:hypothetical protein
MDKALEKKSILMKDGNLVWGMLPTQQETLIMAAMEELMLS